MLRQTAPSCHWTLVRFVVFGLDDPEDASRDDEQKNEANQDDRPPEKTVNGLVEDSQETVGRFALLDSQRIRHLSNGCVPLRADLSAHLPDRVVALACNGMLYLIDGIAAQLRDIAAEFFD